MDGKFTRFSTKVNSINEIRRMNKNQADQPMRGIDDDIIMEEHPDPLQAIKEQLMNSQPQPVSVRTRMFWNRKSPWEALRLEIEMI